MGQETESCGILPVSVVKSLSFCVPVRLYTYFIDFRLKYTP